MRRRKAFRSLIKAGSFTIVPGTVDALGARLVQQAEFKAVYLTGRGLARSWAFPDVGLITMTENLAAIARCVDAVDIPISRMRTTFTGMP